MLNADHGLAVQANQQQQSIRIVDPNQKSTIASRSVFSPNSNNIYTLIMTLTRLLLIISVVLVIAGEAQSFSASSIPQPTIFTQHQPSPRTRSHNGIQYGRGTAASASATTRSLAVLFGKKAARAEGNERKSKTERVRKVKDDVIEVEGVVLESLPNAMFRCAIKEAPDTQEPVLATISGKIRKNFVKILVGDKVLIELSPYDLTRGRITFRYR